MKTRCVICDNEIDLDIDEFIEIEEDIDDYVCEDCADICLQEAPIWWKEIQSHVN